MTLKNRSVIEVEVLGREYRFECVSEAPLAEVVQAHNLIGTYLQDRLNSLQQNPDVEKQLEEVEP